MKKNHFCVFFSLLVIAFTLSACNVDPQGENLELCKSAFVLLHETEVFHYSTHTLFENSGEQSESTTEAWHNGKDFTSYTYSDTGESWLLYKDGQLFSKMNGDEVWFQYGEVSTVALPFWKTNDWSDMALQVVEITKTDGDTFITCAPKGRSDDYSISFRFIGDELISLIVHNTTLDAHGIQWDMTTTYTIHKSSQSEIVSKISAVHEQIS